MTSLESKQAEKLKSCEMKERWMKNDEGWMMRGNVFKLSRGFADWQTDEQTFVNVEFLLQLKNYETLRML